MPHTKAPGPVAFATPVLLCSLLLACQGGRETLGESPSRAEESPRAESYPLLGDPRGGNAWSNYCAGKPDTAVLPRDPRELLVPGVNEGRAVAMNAYWRDCGNVVARPSTCGEMRAQSELGAFVAHGNGEVGSPLSFAGGQEQPGGLPAADYNNMWQVWGLDERPDNFDELVAQRHGAPLTPCQVDRVVKESTLPSDPA